MKKKNLFLNSGNKGMWFTVDAIFALLLVLVVIILSYNHLNYSNMPNAAITLDVNDQFIVMDKLNELDSLDIVAIKAELKDKYEYKIEINCESSGLINDSSAIPETKFIFSNEIPFYANENCRLRYWSWLK